MVFTFCFLEMFPNNKVTDTFYYYGDLVGDGREAVVWPDADARRGDVPPGADRRERAGVTLLSPNESTIGDSYYNITSAATTGEGTHIFGATARVRPVVTVTIAKEWRSKSKEWLYV